MGGGGGGRRGGGIAIGGGAGVLVLLLALLFGVNPGDILGGGAAAPQQTSDPTAFAQCKRGSDVSRDRDCRFVAFTNSIQEYWSQQVQGYQEIQVKTFTGGTDTA